MFCFPTYSTGLTLLLLGMEGGEHATGVRPSVRRSVSTRPPTVGPTGSPAATPSSSNNTKEEKSAATAAAALIIIAEKPERRIGMGLGRRRRARCMVVVEVGWGEDRGNTRRGEERKTSLSRSDA